MNWQLLKNVNPPIGKIIMLFDANSLSVLYARRIGLQGQSLQFSHTYQNGGIGLHPDELDYKTFKEEHGNKIYWSPFIKP
ncbi:MAG TPA: hypothetical protein IAC89_01675 [Candidatus Aphodousia faecalis]|nr:hypothetical protein [Candidatus Aphodousia faecalis]